MSDSLNGKRALVTGASKGIGLAIAEVLVKQGVQVVICARQETELHRALDFLKKSAPGTKTAGCVADEGWRISHHLLSANLTGHS